MRVESIKKIVAALNNADVEYVIVGGLAVVLHGYVNYTDDLDLVLELEKENIERAIKTLESLKYRPTISMDAINLANEVKRKKWRVEEQKIVLRFLSQDHPDTPIDTLLEEPFNVEEELNRIVKMELEPGLMAPVVSLETLIGIKGKKIHAKDAIDLEQLLWLGEMKNEKPCKYRRHDRRGALGSRYVGRQ